MVLGWTGFWVFYPLIRIVRTKKPMVIVTMVGEPFVSKMASTEGDAEWRRILKEKRGGANEKS